MALNIISAKQFATKLKVTIQSSGRLGFTDDTAKSLDLSLGKYAKFAQDDEKGILYLVVLDSADEDAFPIRESGGYFYVPTKQMFDMFSKNLIFNKIVF